MELKHDSPCDAFDGDMDDNIDWDFREFAIDAVVGPDKFSIRWKGYIVSPSPGKYCLSTWADDGIRVKVDGSLLIDTWKGPGVHQSALLEFDGKPHEIEVECLERTASAFVSVHWSKNGEIEDEVIPASAFFSTLSAATKACKAAGGDKGR
jgi:mannan endo-1,4-beta-mannosidase